ncbi:hypothetical protein GLOIN_2v1764522 [Rhizophagus clarus]|uniref:Uncharacterized protein n=1 Tax=Rhizophagus clarus TaxID=94130 RepID=A0A8H3QNQ3_9GLOM|nr:hypothetical protein GLOIN_2v1764522 [Rhizophagus clarus]
MLTSFILRWTAENNSFYASLQTGPVSQNQELMSSDSLFINNSIEQKKLEESRELKKNINEIDNSAISTILEEIRVNYQSGDPHLRTALDKFAE